MPTPTGKHINIANATYQPLGTGTLLPIVGAKDATLDLAPQVIKESGDADVYMSIVAAVGQDPTITLSSNTAFQLLTVTPGTWGTLTFDVPDAQNGTAAGGGGYAITMTHAVMEKNSRQFGHRKFAGLSLSFSSYAPDGITSPVSIVAL